ncbi:serine dehydratase-like [Convolutriloba macropyga]|uniref:serine dehydratase-like n=1 Tax=Convolutriloba macropyga TaxID=536237 RepID=UPI003F527350
MIEKKQNSESGQLHVETLLMRSTTLSSENGFEVLLKLDNLQLPGSFKIRGIGNMCVKSLKERPEAKCFVCSSGGNAGLAASYAAAQLKKPIHVFVPKTTSEFVREQFKLYPGSQVHVYGEVWDEANEKAVEFCESVGGIMVPPYDHPYIWEGNSTLMDELRNQLSPETIPSCIVVSVGGGGLLLGIIEGLKRHPKWGAVPIVAVETLGADCLSLSLQTGSSFRLQTISSIAKSLAALEPCPELLGRIERNEANILSAVVTDDEALDACKRFLVDHRMLVEPACGAALSTAYGNVLRKFHQEGLIDCSQGPVVIIVCGGVSVQMLL